MNNLNNYNKICKQYVKSNSKPDKLFSHLPTVLNISGVIKNKDVLDLGCGSGFYTNAFVLCGAKNAIGMDNSIEQIELARTKSKQKSLFIFGDIFESELPPSDIVCAPYVMNYSSNVHELRSLLVKIFNSLKEKGKLIGVVDMPNNFDLKKFGARKTIGRKEDGEIINIDLFNGDEKICTLHSRYYKKDTINEILLNIGFKHILWHQPIVSGEGVDIYGESFWREYLKETELGYFTADK